MDLLEFVCYNYGQNINMTDMTERRNCMYRFQSLKEVSYAEITDCFNLAFSDYALPTQLTKDQMKALFIGSGVDKELSFGAFLDDQMVGFILNSCSIYHHQKAVFDVGTGVVPSHRGNKVFTKLFSYAKQELLKHGIEKYYLEVLQGNDKAILAYKKQGFEIIREFSVLKCSSTIKKTADVNLSDMMIADMEKFDFAKVNHCYYVEPCYEHSFPILNRNAHLYAIAYREKEGKITAFCIFSKDKGRILQFGYTNIGELKIIVLLLMEKFRDLFVKNIDRRYVEVLDMFYSLGFTEITQQFEMAKDLTSR